MDRFSAPPKAPVRVAQVGTGNVGGHALAELITNPQFELTGVWVSSEAKVGKDAAELAGLDTPTGIKATNDLNAVLAAQPECAVYTAMADNRLIEALEDYRRILAAGVNVVGSGPVFLQYPWQVIPDELIAPLQDAAKAGQASLFVNGIDPGFANDLLPLALAGTCQSLEYTRVPAPEAFDIASGHIPEGTTAALRFEVQGIVDGKPAVVLEHVTRLRDDLCPDWPQPAQEGGSYRIEITGEPNYALDLCLSSGKGDHNHAGLVATAARIVNAIPAVVAAEPGITTTLDLPLITGKGLYAAS